MTIFRLLKAPVPVVSSPYRWSLFFYSSWWGGGGGGEIFRTLPDRPLVHTVSCCNVYWVSFPGLKRPRRGVDPSQPSSAEVKETVEQYLYPLWAFVVCCRVNLNLLTLKVKLRANRTVILLMETETGVFGKGCWEQCMDLSDTRPERNALWRSSIV